MLSFRIWIICVSQGPRNWSADWNKGDAGHLHGSDDAQGCDGLQPWSQYCTEQLVGQYDVLSINCFRKALVRIFESNWFSILLPRWGLLCFPASLSAFQVLLELQLVSCIRISTTFQLDKNRTSNNALYAYHQVLVFLVCPLPFLSRSVTGYFRSQIHFSSRAFKEQTFQLPYSSKLQGIAGGTFLYITFFEVLPHELNIPSKRLWKVFKIGNSIPED